MVISNLIFMHTNIKNYDKLDLNKHKRFNHKLKKINFNSAYLKLKSLLLLQFI